MLNLYFWTWGFSILKNNFRLLIYLSLNFSKIPRISLSLIFDWLAITFLGSVAIIASGVFYFSQAYMAAEKYKIRFSIILTIFVFRIFTLIIRGDLVFIIIGWDGLGLSSYLLVIYFNRAKSNNAGLITALTNRLGDVAIILTISLLLWNNSWIIREIVFYKISESKLRAVLLIVARFTKSAQVPFSAWLPAAIAAPTPVSALVHSSTLVTAGVYLLIRIEIYIKIINLHWIILLFGGITLTVARITALAETDIKKIVALSTLSQLGLIIIILGINQTLITFFHLNTHAFFKSLLFINTGDIIHNTAGYQDLRKIEHSHFFRKNLSILIFVANARLIGTPLLSGFYSKDLFLEINFYGPQRMLFFIFLYLRLLITIIYTVRFLSLRIFKAHKSSHLISPQETPINHVFYSSLLFILSITGGRALNWIINPCNNFIFLPLTIKIITLVLFGIVIIANKIIPKLGFSYPQIIKPWFSLIFLDKLVGQLARQVASGANIHFNVKNEKILLQPEALSLSFIFSNSRITKFNSYSTTFSYIRIVLIIILISLI